MINAARKNRYREIRRWRKFRDRCLKAETTEQIARILKDMPGFLKLTITAGWLDRVRLDTQTGSYYSEKVFAYDALQEIAMTIYHQKLKDP